MFSVDPRQPLEWMRASVRMMILPKIWLILQRNPPSNKLFCPGRVSHWWVSTAALWNVHPNLVRLHRLPLIFHSGSTSHFIMKIDDSQSPWSSQARFTLVSLTQYRKILRCVLPLFGNSRRSWCRIGLVFVGRLLPQRQATEKQALR